MARNGKYARLLWGHLPTLNLEVVGYIPGSKEVQREYSRTQHNDVIYMKLKIRLLYQESSSLIIRPPWPLVHVLNKQVKSTSLPLKYLVVDAIDFTLTDNLPDEADFLAACVAGPFSVLVSVILVVVGGSVFSLHAGSKKKQINKLK